MKEPVWSTEGADSRTTLTVIRPRKGWKLIDLVEVWRYRDLLWILALRDIKVRYKQTLIGGLWAVLQPLTTMLAFTVLFQLLGRAPASPDVPYPVTLYCALLPWQLFATALSQASDSLVANQNLITKIYFPRIIIPVAPILAGLVDFAVAFGVFLLLLLWYGVVPGYAVLTLPFFVLYAVLAALSVGIWLAALNALYRDFRYAVPFLIQIGFVVSPVLFETRALIPERWQLLYGLNPMVGVIEGFRWAILGKDHPPLAPMLLSAGAVVALLLGGLIYFRRMEKLFADQV